MASTMHEFFEFAKIFGLWATSSITLAYYLIRTLERTADRYRADSKMYQEDAKQSQKERNEERDRYLASIAQVTQSLNQITEAMKELTKAVQTGGDEIRRQARDTGKRR